MTFSVGKEQSVSFKTLRKFTKMSTQNKTFKTNCNLLMDKCIYIMQKINWWEGYMIYKDIFTLTRYITKQQ